MLEERFNNDVYIRAPRGWMKELAKNLNCSYTKKSKIMFKDERILSFQGFFSFIFGIYKKTPLPPIEWFVDYSILCPDSKKSSFIIDCGSKLIKTRKNYVSYVENGLGLFGFNTIKLNHINFFIFKNKIKKENFKGFVFYSKAARESTKRIFLEMGCIHLFFIKDLGIVYPYTSDSPSNFNKYDSGTFNILFCSSSFNLKGGREVVESITELLDELKIELTVVSDLKSKELDKYRELKFVRFLDFKLSPEEFNEVMSKHHMVIHPTYFDTHALALLEGLKSHLPGISTNTFAISEYIINGYNGILLTNPCQPYGHRFSPNFRGEPLNFAESLMDDDLSFKLKSDLTVSIKKMILNYDEYYSNNIDFFDNSEFSEFLIINKWKKIIRDLKS